LLRCQHARHRESSIADFVFGDSLRQVVQPARHCGRRDTARHKVRAIHGSMPP
jgi:hypothetical protein